MSSADADVRLARRIKRDTAVNSRDIGAVLDQVATFNRTTFTVFPLIFPTFTAFQGLEMSF